MYEITMPRLSDSMEEGTIVRWLVEDGAEVGRGDDLVEIETDKATMTYEADASGTLSISAPEGATVPVGAPIGTIGDAVAAGATATLQAAPAAAPRRAANGRARVSASPVARRIAAQLGLELAGVPGTGPYGRVLKADVMAAGAATPPPAAPPPSAEPVPAPPAVPAAAAVPAPAAPGPGTTVQDLTRTQERIARRMAESRATVPEFALEVDVDMTEAVALRAELKRIADPAPSVNDLVVKAVAVALTRHPLANGSFRDGRFELHAGVHVGVAVAAPGSLVVPVVHDADTKSVGAIAREVRAMAARVRAGEITAPEISGGTFTVSNLGMFGIDRFEGIINPPQAAILCVGAIRDRVVPFDGAPAIRPVMSMTLACDHRILYGADAAAFLAEVRGLLETPLALAL